METRTVVAIVAAVIAGIPLIVSAVRYAHLDAIKSRRIERHRAELKHAVEVSERFRQHLCIRELGIDIESQRRAREYIRRRSLPYSWVGLIVGFSTLYLQNFTPAILATRWYLPFILLTLLSIQIALIYVAFAGLLEARHMKGMSAILGNGWSKIRLPALMIAAFSVRLSPPVLRNRIYNRTAVALKRRPFDAGFLDGYLLDEEFVRRMHVEYEYEVRSIAKTYYRIPRWRIAAYAFTFPFRFMLSPRSRRRALRAKRAMSRGCTTISIDRVPSFDVRGDEAAPK